MAIRSSNTAAPAELVARLGGLLMALVAGRDQRLRETIARAVMRSCRHDDLELMMHWNAGRNPASNRRVE
jgi:hypothetical protein